MFWLVPQLNTFTPQQTVVQVQKLEKVLRSPSQAPPDFSLLRPLLTTVCHVDSDHIVRQAGFNLLTAYLEVSQRVESGSDELLQHATAWHLIRSTPPSKSALNEDWEQRVRALSALTASGSDIQGLSDLVPTLCTWQMDALEVESRDRTVLSDKLVDSRFVNQQRALELQRLLVAICSQNATSLSERDEHCVLVAFLRALDLAVREMWEQRGTIRSEPSDATRKFYAVTPAYQPKLIQS